MKIDKASQDILNKAIPEIKKQYSQGLLPEEKKLFKDTDREYPGPGYHIHNEDNPAGKHRHLKDESIDGLHRHTVINPFGEHIHGEFEGQAIVNGTHYHDYGGFGYHNHREDEVDYGKIVPEKPDKIL